MSHVCSSTDLVDATLRWACSDMVTSRVRLQAVREFGLPPFVPAKAVQSWVHRHKVGVGIFNNLNLVVIVRLHLSHN